MRLIHHMTPILALTMLSAISCGSTAKSDAGTAGDTVAFTEQGSFSQDSAYAYVASQTAFGPRTPQSEAHDKCVSWISDKLSQFGADTVTIINSDTKVWDGKNLPVHNIFARFGVDKAERIILLAHYDTRPWADQDSDPANRAKPIDGANDGASGVAVILEIARNIGLQEPAIGVDILFTDVEDYGAPQDVDIPDSESTWALGAKHFAQNLPYDSDNLPKYGILLDMVGGRDAKFNREYFSIRRAPAPTAKVWAMAEKLGLRDRFPMTPGGAITDDHLPMTDAGIPTVDIIENANPSTGSFAPTWHTLNDNIDNIDPESLAAAGRVVLNVIYNEK